MKLIENLLIRQFIYRYRDFKEKNPGKTQEELCDLVLKNRIKNYPSIFLLRDNSDDKIKILIEEAFNSKSKNLFNICKWLITAQYSKKYYLNLASNINKWKRDDKELDETINKFIIKIPGI